jgi:Kef-type K+ transport system membrane component KefB
MELGNVFYEFALLLAAAAILGLIAHYLKQPLIVAFIAVGILVGPAGIVGCELFS